MTKNQFLKGMEVLHLRFSLFDKKTMTVWHFSKQDIAKLYIELTDMNYQEYMAECLHFSKQKNPPTVQEFRQTLGIHDMVTGQLNLFTETNEHKGA